MARVELSETTKVPFGGRGARRKPDKEGGSLNEVKTTHDAVWRRESRHAPAKARKEANVSETGHDRQARRRLCGTLRTKECKYGFACPKRGLCDATNSHRVTRAAEIAAVSRADRCLGEADCAGLHPEDVLVYVEWVQGRAIRPHKRGSTRIEAEGRHSRAQRRPVPRHPPHFDESLMIGTVV